MPHFLKQPFQSVTQKFIFYVSGTLQEIESLTKYVFFPNKTVSQQSHSKIKPLIRNPVNNKISNKTEIHAFHALAALSLQHKQLLKHKHS
jgi:hypothetical protein